MPSKYDMCSYNKTGDFGRFLNLNSTAYKKASRKSKRQTNKYFTVQLKKIELFNSTCTKRKLNFAIKFLKKMFGIAFSVRQHIT